MMLTPHFHSIRGIAAARRAEIALLALCLFLFFWRLGAARLFDLDEGLYITCARNMALSGDWVTPRLNSRPHERPNERFVPFFEKPILVYWLSAASMRAFGISERSGRIPVAAASLIATALVVWIGRRWFGRRAGLLAGLVYSTAPLTILDARQMTTDALLVLWFLIAMIAYVEGSAVLFWLSCALAILTKGLVGLLLPALVVGCYRLTIWILERRGRRLPPIRTPKRGMAARHAIGITLFLCLTIPWHVAIWKAGGLDLNGRNWVQEYVIVQHVGRFKGKDIHHNAPPPTYLAYFLIGFFPWACFAPAAFRRRAGTTGTGEDNAALPLPETATATASGTHGDVNEQYEGRSPPTYTLHVFLLCWFWTIFLFFSASAAKLPTYIVPVYPAAALLIGNWLDRRVCGNGRRQSPKALHAGVIAALVTAVLLAITTLLIPLFTRSRPVMPTDAARLAQCATITLSVGCLVALLLIWRAQTRSASTGIAGLAVTMALLTGMIVGPGYEIANRWIFGPYQDLAAMARQDARKGLPIVYYDFGDRRPSMLYYGADYSPLERKESPLLPFLRRYIDLKSPAADVITLRSTVVTELKPELDAANWEAEQISERNSGLATWVLLRVHPSGAAATSHSTESKGAWLPRDKSGEQPQDHGIGSQRVRPGH